jgi:hypothetical protein
MILNMTAGITDMQTSQFSIVDTHSYDNEDAKELHLSMRFSAYLRLLVSRC